jgi:hypothetical protein
MLISNRYTRILEITATLILPTKALFLIESVVPVFSIGYNRQQSVGIAQNKGFRRVCVVAVATSSGHKARKIAPC